MRKLIINLNTMLARRQKWNPGRHARCRVQRAPPPSPTAVVHEILQWGPHVPIDQSRRMKTSPAHIVLAIADALIDRRELEWRG
jgi:hypothetical protein